MPHPTQKGIQFSLSSFDPAIKAHADALATGRGVSLRELTESLIEEAYRKEVEMSNHTQTMAERIDDAFSKCFRNVSVIRGGKNSGHAWARKAGWYILYDGFDYMDKSTGRQSLFFKSTAEALAYADSREEQAPPLKDVPMNYGM